jgi:hypothetical protein
MIVVVLFLAMGGDAAGVERVILLAVQDGSGMSASEVENGLVIPVEQAPQRLEGVAHLSAEEPSASALRRLRCS